MAKRGVVLIIAAVVFALGFWTGNHLMPVQGQAKPGAGFAAVPGSEGW